MGRSQSRSDSGCICPALSVVDLSFTFFTVIIHDYHRWEWCALGCFVEMEATTDEAQLCLMVDIVVEVAGIGAGRYQHHYHGIWFQTLLITFPDPLTDGTAIRGIAEDAVPPQLWRRPSSSMVKNLRHFAFSGVAQGSSVKWNSASNWSKNACGVAHRSVVLLNSPFVSRLFLSLSIIIILFPFPTGGCAPCRCG